MLYRLIRLLVRLSLRVFYRRIECEGLENVPETGPVLLVPNHFNALVDPLLIVDQLRRPVTLTAKNILANKRLLGWAMKRAGVVTFHRAEDVGKGADRRQNVASLKRCREILAQGGAVCIFPEGVSHSSAGLRAFRPGPARLAVDFCRRTDSAEPLTIIPVGILYTAKQQFRSDVWIRFGKPIYPKDNPALASPKALTEEIQSRVSELVIDFETRRESALIRWATDIVQTGGKRTAEVGSEPPLTASHFQYAQLLCAGYRELLEQCPEKVEALSRRVRAYANELRRRGLTADEVFLRFDWRRVALFVVRELELIVVGFPLALFGAISHAVPVFAVRRIAKAISHDKDHWASNTIYPGVAVFVVYYTIVVAAAWLLLPPLWALLLTVVIPYTGYYLLLMWDRFWESFRRTRTFIAFLARPQVHARLADEGQAIFEAIRQLESEVDAEKLPPRPAVATTEEADSQREWTAQIELDLKALHDALTSLRELKAQWERAQSEINARERGYFTPEEDDRIRALLLSYRNHRLALYEIIRRYVDYEKISPIEDRMRAFLIGHAAALSIYARTLELLEAYENEPFIRQKLNEPDQKFGIPAGFFDELLAGHRSFVNYHSLMRSDRYCVLHRKTLRRLNIDRDGPWKELCGIVSSERKAIRASMLRVAAARMRHGLSVTRDRFRGRVRRREYGIRSRLGTTFADLRTTWKYHPALTDSVRNELLKDLRTGDILLMRSEPKVTAALLPGFWSHAAIYIGDADQLENLDLPNFESIRHQIPKPKQAEPKQAEPVDGYVLESIYAGVLLRPLGQCLKADHVVVLRPRVDEDQRMQILHEAFAHFGKPYDFNFDFNVSSRLVCTELVYRSLQIRSPIKLQLTKRLGRYTLTADDLIEQLVDFTGDDDRASVVRLALCNSRGEAYFVDPDQHKSTLQAIRDGFRPARQTDTTCEVHS